MNICCTIENSKVLDSRTVHGGRKRRRQCFTCQSLFTSFEAVVPLVKEKSAIQEFADSVNNGILISMETRLQMTAKLRELIATLEDDI